MTQNTVIHLSSDRILVDRLTHSDNQNSELINIAEYEIINNDFDCAILSAKKHITGQENPLIIIPKDQILVISLDGTDFSKNDILSSLVGLTALDTNDLCLDWFSSEGQTHVAAVACDTIKEAVTFLSTHEIQAHSFAALPHGVWGTRIAFFQGSEKKTNGGVENLPTSYLGGLKNLKLIFSTMSGISPKIKYCLFALFICIIFFVLGIDIKGKYTQQSRLYHAHQTPIENEDIETGSAENIDPTRSAPPYILAQTSIGVLQPSDVSIPQSGYSADILSFSPSATVAKTAPRAPIIGIYSGENNIEIAGSNSVEGSAQRYSPQVSVRNDTIPLPKDTADETSPITEAPLNFSPNSSPRIITRDTIGEEVLKNGYTLSELSQYRPKSRPKELVEQAKAEANRVLAANTSIRPTLRPASIKPQPAPESAVSTRISTPTRVSVARAANEKGQLDTKAVSLLGISGPRSNRKALVRMSNGRVVRVKVGDRLNGGRVAAIGTDQLRYVKSGRNIALKMP